MLKLLTLLPFCAALLIPAVAAAKTEPPVACVYVGATHAPRDALADLVKNGLQPRGNADQLLMKQIAATIGGCRTRYGWGEKRQNAAVRYMTARVLREDAVYLGKDLGLTTELLDGLTGKLDPAARASYARGTVSGAMNAAALSHLKEAGLTVETLSPDDQRKLGGLVGQGMAGTVMMLDATDLFNG